VKGGEGRKKKNRPSGQGPCSVLDARQEEKRKRCKDTSGSRRARKGEKGESGANCRPEDRLFLFSSCPVEWSTPEKGRGRGLGVAVNKRKGTTTPCRTTASFFLLQFLPSVYQGRRKKVCKVGEGREKGKRERGEENEREGHLLL